MLPAEPILAEPSQGERMARREHQLPNVLRQDGPRPYWYIRYRVRVLVGKNQTRRIEKRNRLGNCDEIGKRQAERLRDQIMQKVNDQVYTLQTQMPLRDFVITYRRLHVETLAPGARGKYISLLDRHILPGLGELRMCDIGVQDLQEFINGKEKEGLSWWTRNDLKGILSGIFSKAAAWDYWHEDNPAKGIVLGRKKPKRPRRILTDDQTRALLVEVPAQIRLMLLTAISTGMRVSELLALKWGRVDLNRGLLRVEERYYRGDTGEPKSENSKRVLSLGKLTRLYEQFRAAAAGEDTLVFNLHGQPLDDRSILRGIIRPAAKRLGFHFEGFGWHSFRRQNLTVIQEVGATPFEAMAQAGHSRPTMTSEYTVIGLDRREQAVVRLQERILGDWMN
jgi:integrase